MSIIGTGDSMTVTGWYLSDANHVSHFTTASGLTLLDTQVSALANAMAGFAVPPFGQTALTAEQHQDLDMVIAANWRTG